MYRLFLAQRYLRSRLVILLAWGGVALGVAGLVIIMSVMAGLGDSMRQRLRGTSSDVLIEEPTGRGITNYEQLIARIGSDVGGVAAMAPFIERPVMVTPMRMATDPDGGGRYTPMDREEPCMLKGIDPARERRVGRLDEYLQTYQKETSAAEQKEFAERGPAIFRTDRNEVILGRTLMSPRDGRLFPSRMIITAPVYGEMLENVYYDRFETIGRFKTGDADYDSHYLLVSLSAAQELTKMDDAVSGIQVKVAQGADVTAVKERIAALVAAEGHRYTVLRWEEKRKEVLDAIDLEKVLSGIIIFLAIVVASFGLASILDMTVSNKKYDIGILASVGADRSGIAQVFLVAGGLIGAIGSAVGLALGVLAVTNLNTILAFLDRHLGIKIFDPTLYYFESIPTRWDISTYIIIVTATVAVCTMASVVPAMHAARLRPIESLAAGR